ncbi:hypothetical protein HDU87_006767 [Geranomyces variabilis]|uniref:Uncharacterized protein n=1 Tax=Geranomyces variabilis TaxID=109894 RepID=A0AAD5TPV6_9FUNG|nr:hypothetical protein HDU87_006767 [Geranomyces variabilis]
MDSTATDNIFAQRKRSNFASRFRRRFQKPPPPHNQPQPQQPQQPQQQQPHQQRFSQAPSPQVASTPVLAALAKQQDTAAWPTASRRGGTYIAANPKRASVAPLRRGQQQYQQQQRQQQSARTSRRRSVLVSSVADSLYSDVAVPEKEHSVASVATADGRHQNPRRTSHHHHRRRRSGAIFSTSTVASALKAADDDDKVISAEQQHSDQRQSTIHQRTHSLEMLLNELDALRKAGDKHANSQRQAEHEQHLVNRAARFSGSTSSTLSTASRLHNITALAAQSSHELGNRREVVIVTSPLDHAALTPVVATVPRTQKTSPVEDAPRAAGNGRDKHNVNPGNGWIAALGELLGSSASQTPAPPLPPPPPPSPPQQEEKLSAPHSFRSATRDAVLTTPPPPPPQQEEKLSARHSFRSATRDAVLTTPPPPSPSPSPSSPAASSPAQKKTIPQLNAVKSSLLLEKQPGHTRLSISAATNNPISTALPATSVSLATNNLRVVRVCRGTTYTGSMLRSTTATQSPPPPSPSSPQSPRSAGSRRKAARRRSGVAKNNRRGSGDSGFEDGTEPELKNGAEKKNAQETAGAREEDEDDDANSWEDVNYEKDVWVASPQLQLADMGLRQKRRTTVRRSVAFALHDTVVVVATPTARPSRLRRLFGSR